MINTEFVVISLMHKTKLRNLTNITTPNAEIFGSELCNKSLNHKMESTLCLVVITWLVTDDSGLRSG